MKVIALISGGKDSCYNMMQCVQHGHEIVALANLKPSNTDELDSYMYQTVGHQAIDLYAEAMGLPLYRRTIQGSSVELGKDYIKNDKDEVEDLYQLLLSIKSEIEFDAVSAGAILSDYQRVRVEHVCSRLGVSSLAYLWRREQKELYEEMIANGLVAVIVKVAVMGLVPRKHLGLKMVELLPLLSKLNSQFGLNMCGEGGEYETFTLDCPLFQKQIVIDNSEVVIHSDDAFAEVGYLCFKAMHLEDKSNEEPIKALSTIIKELPIQYSGDSIENVPDATLNENKEPFEKYSVSIYVPEELGKNNYTGKGLFNDTGGYLWITSLKGYKKESLSVEEITKNVMDKLKDELSYHNSCLDDVILIQLFIKNMKDFSRINLIYKQYFQVNPPARACIELNLEGNMILQLDCLLYRPTHIQVDKHQISSVEHDEQHTKPRHFKEAMHVQSISHWASANIGPYSQVIKVGTLMLVSGCIGLWPATMTIVDGGIATQAALSLRHVDRIINALSSVESLFNVLYGFCYVTCYEDIEVAEKAFKKAIKAKAQSSCKESRSAGLICYIVVPYLPKGALVEYQMMTHSEPDQWQGFSRSINCVRASLEFQGVCYRKTRMCGVVNCDIISVPDATVINLQEILSSYFEELLKTCTQYELSMKDLLTMRIFYVESAMTSSTAEIYTCVANTLEQKVTLMPAFTLLPVEGLKGRALIMITCWFQS